MYSPKSIFFISFIALNVSFILCDDSSKKNGPKVTDIVSMTFYSSLRGETDLSYICIVPCRFSLTLILVKKNLVELKLDYLEKPFLKLCRILLNYPRKRKAKDTKEANSIVLLKIS